MSSPIDHQRWREGLVAWYRLRRELGEMAADDDLDPSGHRTLTDRMGGQ